MAATLVRAGWIVTMDPALGALREGGVLAEDGRIAAVGRNLPPAPGVEVIDAPEAIVIPGLVNARQHAWQTAPRGMAGDWTILEYFRHVHAGRAEPDRLLRHDADGLVPQHADARAHRRRHRRAGRIGNPGRRILADADPSPKASART